MEQSTLFILVEEVITYFKEIPNTEDENRNYLFFQKISQTFFKSFKLYRTKKMVCMRFKTETEGQY